MDRPHTSWADWLTSRSVVANDIMVPMLSVPLSATLLTATANAFSRVRNVPSLVFAAMVVS